MKYFFLLFFISIARATTSTAPIDDFPGCAENSICTKETGKHRTLWLEILKKFDNKKLDAKSVDNILHETTGFPIPVWGTEDALKNPNSFFWDSHCKQHKPPLKKYFIGLTFIKKMLPKNNLMFHSPAVLLDEKRTPSLLSVLRGDSPLFIVNDSLYYTRDEEGHYFGLLLSPKGNLTFTDTISDTHYPREVACTKEQVEIFNKEVPSPDFFKGYYCKEIWNFKTKLYQSILTGWSCN